MVGVGEGVRRPGSPHKKKKGKEKNEEVEGRRKRRTIRGKDMREDVTVPSKEI